MPSLSFAVMVDDPRLTRTERQILRHVERHTPRDCPELWSAFGTIARALDLSVRTIQAAFARFRAWGWVALRRDYRNLKSRRAYALGWRVELVPLFPEPGRRICAQVSADSAPRSEFPPDPPIEVPEGIEEESSGRDPAGARPATPQPPLSLSDSEPESDPARVAAATAARALFGRDCNARVTELVKLGIPAHVVALAVNRAAALAPSYRAKGRDVTWGLVVFLSREFHRDGPPPALPPRKPASTAITCSPRVSPPADAEPVEPIDWIKLAAEMGSEGHGEAAAMFGALVVESEEKAPAGGHLSKEPPRPVSESLTANPVGNYTVEEGTRMTGLEPATSGVTGRESGQCSPAADSCVSTGQSTGLQSQCSSPTLPTEAPKRGVPTSPPPRPAPHKPHRRETRSVQRSGPVPIAFALARSLARFP